MIASFPSRCKQICLIGILAALVVGCAAPDAFLPKPYRPADKGHNRLSQMSLPGHIVVPQVDGFEDAMAALIAGEVADALLERQIIATTTSPPQQTSVLRGRLMAQPNGLTVVRWVLLNPGGTIAARFEIPVARDLQVVPANGPQARQLADSLGQKVAVHVIEVRQRDTAINRSIQPLAPRDGISPVSTTGLGQKIIVTAIFNTTDKGNHHLRKGLAAALAGAGFIPVERPDKTTWQLQGIITLAESRAGFEQLTLNWELKSPEGQVVANIDQENDIPAGSLPGNWPVLAPLVTQGAATGIADFFHKQNGQS